MRIFHTVLVGHFPDHLAQFVYLFGCWHFFSSQRESPSTAVGQRLILACVSAEKL
jgi:hypothetical protein